jgi:DNA polymerase III alpha subunit
MCAQISSEIGNFDKLPGFVAEAKDIGLELKLPDVNNSGARFEPTLDAKGIRFGLGGIKGVGMVAAEAIVAERKANGPYAGFMDFCMRLAGHNVINKRVLENLTRTGAFSEIEENRAKLFNNIDYALKKTQQKAKENLSLQANFFDMMADGGKEVISDADLADFPPFSPAEDLKNERELLGIYVSGNPLSACSELMKELCVMRVDRKENDELLPFSFSVVERNKNQQTEQDDEGEEGRVEEIQEEDSSSSSFDDIESLLKTGDEKEWILKGFARNVVRAEGKVNPLDKIAFNNAVLKAKKSIRPKIDKRLLKKIDVRAIGVLDNCIVKTPKPRPDGSIGAKWAILGLDDGTGRLEGAAFAKVWEKCSSLETKAGNLVLVVGELAHKPVYDKEDVKRLNPQVGDVSFSLKEAYLLEEAMPILSKGLRIRIDASDPKCAEKAEAIKMAICRNPGKLPVFFEIHHEGNIIDLSLGQSYSVAVTLSFLSELDKVVSQQDINFAPSDDFSLVQREVMPWEM